MSIIAVDFDGVIHSYENGWQNGVIYGSVVPGFFPWLESVSEKFSVYIYSSRSKDVQLRMAMASWIDARYDEWKKETGSTTPKVSLTYTDKKPPAYVTIDDRALTFNGKWDDPMFSKEALRAFKPWNKQ